MCHKMLAPDPIGYRGDRALRLSRWGIPQWGDSVTPHAAIHRAGPCSAHRANRCERLGRNPRVQTMRLPSRPAAVAASQRRAVCTTPPPPESVNPTSAHHRAEFVGDCVGRDRREADIDAEDAAIDPGARRFAVKALEKRAFRDFSPVRHEDIAALSEPGGCSSCEGFASRIDCPLRRPQVRLEARLRAEQVTPPAHATASSPSSCDDSRLPHRPGVGRLLADGPTSGTQTATYRSAPSCQGSYRYSVENPEVSLKRSRAMYWDVTTEDS